MPKIMVRVYTTLKDRVGAPKLVLEGDTVGDIINSLYHRHSEICSVLLDAKGIVRNYFVLSLNSEILDHKSLGKIKTTEGDILHIFPPVSGG